MKVEFAPRARIDLVEIGDYLERVAGKRTARKWVARLQARARALGEHPYASHEQPDLGGRRRAVVRPYLVVYRIALDTVRIVRVVHGARDLPAIFGDDDG